MEFDYNVKFLSCKTKTSSKTHKDYYLVNLLIDGTAVEIISDINLSGQEFGNDLILTFLYNVKYKSLKIVALA